jgi:hypothetical protein
VRQVDETGLHRVRLRVQAHDVVGRQMAGIGPIARVSSRAEIKIFETR